jgi:hypothetical protein
MSASNKILLAIAWSAAAGIAAAQQPPAASPPPASAPAATVPATAAPAPPTTVTKTGKTGAQAEAGDPRADTSRPPPATPPGTAQKSQNKVDRLDLSTATVTGDREQPKVMYIVPWKKADMGDLGGRPMNSLLDEVLAPVDRDVFRRQVDYYGVVQADAVHNGAPGKAPGDQGEK